MLVDLKIQVALVTLSDAELSLAHESNLFQDRIQQEYFQYQCFSALQTSY